MVHFPNALQGPSNGYRSRIGDGALLDPAHPGSSRFAMLTDLVAKL